MPSSREDPFQIQAKRISVKAKGEYPVAPILSTTGRLLFYGISQNTLVFFHSKFTEQIVSESHKLSFHFLLL